MQEVTSDIIKILGEQPGTAVAVFAGVHGNETAGVYALQEIIPKLHITKGEVYFVFGNPPAIEANVRMGEKNLNRCFVEGIEGDSYEENRARELMEVLQKCDALLDIHMFSDPEGEPFVICEENAFNIAKLFDVGIVSTNWSEAEPGGTDAYMYRNGKVGICLECGPIDKAREYKDFAVKAIYQFLQYYDMLTFDVDVSTQPKRIVRAGYSIVKQDDSLMLSEGFHNFDRLNEGQVIATSDTETFCAKAGECIIFPRYYANVGQELYIVGMELSDKLAYRYNSSNDTATTWR